MRSLKEQMKKELEQKDIFELAKELAYSYLDSVNDKDAYPDKKSIENLKIFDEELPKNSNSSQKVLKLLHNYGSPATTAQIGGRYFGFVNGGVLPISLAVRWLSDTWDQNGALFVMSPVVSKLEEVVQGWMVDLLDLPKESVVGFVSGTSQATFCAIAAARYRILKSLGWDVNRQGLYGAPKVRIIVSKHIHASALKAISLLGFGKDSIEWIEVDTEGRALYSSLPNLDERSIVILQAGNVNSGSFDEFYSICKAANKAKAWVHIDGAFGLWVRASKKLKHLTKGIELASSWSLDAHKSLNTPYDNGMIICKDKEALVGALQASGEYILYSDNRDGMLYTPQMSRRARVVELWAALKYLGKDGVDELIYDLHLKARYFANELQKLGFDVLNEVVFNQILIRYKDDIITKDILEFIQKSGVCWMGSTKWFGKFAIRISISSWATSKDDIDKCIASFKKVIEVLEDENI